MLFPSTRNLSDLCSTRIAYSLWTRPDMISDCEKASLSGQLADTILGNVERLPLPKELKPQILGYVKPTGQHLLDLLSWWISDKLPESPHKWLTSEMLSECLVLNGDGLINPRKTAEKILSSRILPNVTAFRLACLNFLEEEVLKLWISVKEYFLKKIVVESELAKAKDEGRSVPFKATVTKHYKNFVYNREGKPVHFPTFTSEPYEVLFWIAYCLSKEKGVGIDEIPHFVGYDVSWYEISLDFAAFSGNVAFFDYLKNSRHVEYSYLNTIKTICSSEARSWKESSFGFHFWLLNSGETSKLFREYGEDMMLRFLHWPLSLTFLKNPNELWDLLPHRQKLEIFSHIFDVLFEDNIFRLRSERNFISISDPKTISLRRMYHHDQLIKLFVALWEISSEDYKSSFLQDGFFYEIGSWRRQQRFVETFQTSGLKPKLFQLFLSNGEAFLELFEKEDMKESLRSLVAKHMPQDFEDLDKGCISFLETATLKLGNISTYHGYPLMKIRFRTTYTRRIFDYPKHGKLLNYIQNVLF